MQLTYHDKDYEVVIERKARQKNTYIRVKKDLKITVTTGSLTPISFVENLIQNHYDRVTQMIDFQEKKVKNNQGFFYLGKQYVMVTSSEEGIHFVGNMVYVPHGFDVDAWYKKQAKSLFFERFNLLYQSFTRKIPYPKLRIRKMTSRWGVCNVRTHIITLNLELMKRDVSYLDYVIVHEMSHLIYGDHSSSFWKLVEENMPDYKKYREEMKEF